MTHQLIRQAAEAFNGCVEEAGLLVGQLDPEIEEVIWREWRAPTTLPTERDIWLSVVFELAFQNHTGAGLKAERSGWRDRTSAPIDVIAAHLADPSFATPISDVAKAVGSPPAYWFSKIDNLWQASVAAIDLLALMIEATPAVEMPQVHSKVNASPQRAEGRGGASIEEIEADTPALDKTSGEWLKAGDPKMRSEASTKSLRTLRSDTKAGAQKTEDGTFGVDRSGRRWRKDSAASTAVWYWTGSLKGQHQ
ncbi:MAG: hypothetical protein AAF805_01070 [Planctomycetota bacterium]